MRAWCWRHAEVLVIGTMWLLAMAGVLALVQFTR